MPKLVRHGKHITSTKVSCASKIPSLVPLNQGHQFVPIPSKPAVSSSSLPSTIPPPTVMNDIQPSIEDKHHSLLMNDMEGRCKAIQEFIKCLVIRKTFCLNGIKRAMNKYIYSSTAPLSPGSIPIYKPDGLDIYDLYYTNPEVFGYGTIKLPPSSYPLKVDRILEYHTSCCNLCQSPDNLSSDCYMVHLIRCVEFGWQPPVHVDKIFPLYSVAGNYPTVAQYPDNVAAEVQSMVDQKVLIPCSDRIPGVINPLGAIIKNSDKLRALTLVGINIVDQPSLSSANHSLLSQGHPKVKVRITTDCSAPGTNRATFSPPFSYPSLQDGIKIIKRNSYLGKTDIGRYFHSFPLSFSIRHLFRIFFCGMLYMYACCCFGFTLCPYYCSTWSAEIRRWMLKHVGNCAHMVDDWLFVGMTYDETHHLLSLAANILTTVGFFLAVEKNEIGQQLNYLGVLLDTVSMTCRIDPIQAKGMRIQLEYYLDCIMRDRHLDKPTINSVCGKLNWFSELLQSGRIHIKHWWDYYRHGSQLCKTTKLRLITDTQWWLDILARWENSSDSTLEYPIWSADEILSQPHSIYICQSDASGTDGFGYFHGWYASSTLQYTSKRWKDIVHGADSSSHHDELYSLLDFLINVPLPPCILVWITDSQSAAYSVNKGNCNSQPSFLNLQYILRLCDQYHATIIALWVPRENNTFADYLSHLSSYLNRDTVHGSVSTVAGAV